MNCLRSWQRPNSSVVPRIPTSVIYFRTSGQYLFLTHTSSNLATPLDFPCQYTIMFLCLSSSNKRTKFYWLHSPLHVHTFLSFPWLLLSLKDLSTLFLQNSPSILYWACRNCFHPHPSLEIALMKATSDLPNTNSYGHYLYRTCQWPFTEINTPFFYNIFIPWYLRATLLSVFWYSSHFLPLPFTFSFSSTWPLNTDPLPFFVYTQPLSFHGF